MALTAVTQWLIKHFGYSDFTLEALPQDCGFRRYFRIKTKLQASFILMMAPPGLERTDDFVNIAQHWKKNNICVPQIFAWEPTQGWLVLSDFGNLILSNVLNLENIEILYTKALNIILDIQMLSPQTLKCFDEEVILFGIELGQEWFFKRLLDISPYVINKLNSINSLLSEAFHAQPQVTIHRDFHAGNLMYLPNQELGVIDFQDSMKGPISYDLVSLLKDSRVDLPVQIMERLALRFYQILLEQKKLAQHINPAEFLYWYNLTGLQNHLRILGIFARVALRDNKPNYLRHIPRIFQYILNVCKVYPALNVLHNVFNDEIIPQFNQKISLPLTDMAQ